MFCLLLPESRGAQVLDTQGSGVGFRGAGDGLGQTECREGRAGGEGRGQGGTMEPGCFLCGGQGCHSLDRGRKSAAKPSSPFIIIRKHLRRVAARGPGAGPFGPPVPHS